MTSSAGPSVSDSPTAERTSTDPTARELWQRWRVGILAAALIVVIGAAYAIARSGTSGGPMDPQSARQSGARALAVLLEQRGVQVVRTERLDDALAAADRDSTVLVTVPDRLGRSALHRLRDSRAGRLVLFEPGEAVLEVLAPGVYPAGSSFEDVQEPECDLRAARRAGNIDVTGRLYRAPRHRICYGNDDEGGAVVEFVDDARGGRIVQIVGTPSSFQNANLAQQGNAALALDLLGAERRLVWYLPSLADAQVTRGEEPRSLTDLLPSWVRASVAMAFVALVLVALAAARRLGPVVPESLPVVVRAAETTEGHARLYQRVRARDRAAEVLRDAARSRLAAALGHATGVSEESLVAAVADRSGRPSQAVADLLVGDPSDPGPDDDDALIRLADELDRLEQEVRRT